MILGNPPPDYAVINSIMPFHGLVYTFLTVKVISNHNRKVKDSFPILIK